MVSDSNSLALVDIFFALVLPYILTIPIAKIYKKNLEKLSPSPGFLTSLLLFGPLTSVITLLIGSNIARAFGLVAALSIIRFRTALKEAIDSVYLFWVLAVGMACGTGYYLAAVLIVVMGLIFLQITKYLNIEKQNFEKVLLNIDVSTDLNEEHRKTLETRLDQLVTGLELKNTIYDSSQDFYRLIYSAAPQDVLNKPKIEKEITDLDFIKKVQVLNAEASLFI